MVTFFRLLPLSLPSLGPEGCCPSTLEPSHKDSGDGEEVFGKLDLHTGRLEEANGAGEAEPVGGGELLLREGGGGFHAFAKARHGPNFDAHFFSIT